MSTVVRSPLESVHQSSVHISWEGTRSVIWLHGDQDLATVQVLRDVLSAQVAAIDADVVVDLNDVTFMDASTLGALLEGRKSLGERARSFTLRSPPRCASRLLDVCGLRDLLEPRAPRRLLPATR